MKRVSLLLIFAAILMLSACSQSGAGVSSSAVPDKTPAPAPAVGAASSKTQTLEAQSTLGDSQPQTDEEISLAYDQAVQAYSWFVRDALPSSGAPVEVNSSIYRRVEYEGIQTLEDLRQHLLGLFSPALTEELLDEESAAPLYLDIDGVLHTRGTVGGSEVPPHGEETRTIEMRSATAYQVDVTVETLDEDQQTVMGMECFSFPYELVDGRWVFTDFELVG